MRSPDPVLPVCWMGPIPSEHGLVYFYLWFCALELHAFGRVAWRCEREWTRGLDKVCTHNLSSPGDAWNPRFLLSTLRREASKASALRAELQLPQHGLQERLQPVQDHHLCGVERSFQDAALQGLQALGLVEVTALGGGQQLEKVLEVLHVIRYLHQISGRQVDEDLLVGLQ